MNFTDLNPSPEVQKNLETIFQKCHEDMSFKQEFIANPVQALEKISGQSIDTQGFNLVVVDQSDRKSIYLNIPADQENVELTEEELEIVAGGSWEWLTSLFGGGGIQVKTATVVGDNNKVSIE